MAFTDINSEDRLVQKTFAKHLRDGLGWESVYAWKSEFSPSFSWGRIHFENGRGADGKPNNRFLAVRELKLTGLRTPGYNRRADLVCFVNGLPLVFIELKAVYKNIRAGFDGNLRDYMDEHVIAHAFHHNAFLIVSNGPRARYGSITSGWEHFAEWKRLDEDDRKGSVEAERLLNGMLAHERLLDLVENFILFDASKPGATRKVVARNHQMLGVNKAVESVRWQEELKREFPPEKRLKHRVIELPELMAAEEPGDDSSSYDQAVVESLEEAKTRNRPWRSRFISTSGN